MRIERKEKNKNKTEIKNIHIEFSFELSRHLSSFFLINII